MSTTVGFLYIYLSWVLNDATSTVATDKDDWTITYPISDRFREPFEKIIPRWRVNALAVYDTNDKFVKYEDLELRLTGSLVLVYFELRHYAIKDRQTNTVSTNTFTATATQIKILERGGLQTSSPMSPYKSMMMKGPKHLPQSPTRKRQDQINAVNAFHPGNGLTYLLLRGSNFFL